MSDAWILVVRKGEDRESGLEDATEMTAAPSSMPGRLGRRAEPRSSAASFECSDLGALSILTPVSTVNIPPSPAQNGAGDRVRAGLIF